MRGRTPYPGALPHRRRGKQPKKQMEWGAPWLTRLGRLVQKIPINSQSNCGGRPIVRRGRRTFGPNGMTAPAAVLPRGSSLPLSTDQYNLKTGQPRSPFSAERIVPVGRPPTRRLRRCFRMSSSAGAPEPSLPRPYRLRFVECSSYAQSTI